MCSYTRTASSICEDCSGLQKYLCQSILDGLLENTLGCWSDDASCSSFDLVAFQYLGCDGEIFVSSVCRGSDECMIDGCDFDFSEFLYLVDVSGLCYFGVYLFTVYILFVLFDIFGP